MFAKRLGLDPNKIIAVPLTPLNHRNVGGPSINIGAGSNIVASLQAAFDAMGTTVEKAGASQIWQAHKSVYIELGHEEWANAVHEAYFKSMGIPY